MALDDYSGLKTEVGNWMARGDLSGDAATFIKLAEARLNRELKPAIADVSLTGVAASRRIDISAHSVVAPIALFLIQPDGDECRIAPMVDGTFPYLDTSGEPSVWTSDDNATAIDFDTLLDQAYTFRLRCRQRFALSDSATTNWLLTNHSDVYLAAALMWGGGFIKDFPYAGMFKAVLDEAIPSIRHTIAEQYRAVLRVDPALADIGRRTAYTGEWA